MIKLENISKCFGSGASAVRALDRVDLEVPAGAIFGVIGTSGAGKSTLIRCVNLLERPTEGRVFVDGIELTALDEKALRAQRHQIGMIFQHFNLLSSRTIYDNIALPLELTGASAADIRAAVEPLLELTGLSEKRDQYPNQLSGGQKQRVAIARALAVKPKVLLCDEATSALDPKTTQSILELLADINRRLGITILLITHEMDVVKSICDQVAVISAGRIIEQNRVEPFFLEPKTELAREFVRTAMHEKLPEAIEQQLLARPAADCHPVVRLSFVGHAVAEPVISQACRRFGVDISILQSSLDYVHGHIMGFMTAELMGTAEATEQALAFIDQQPNVKLEVAGYVRRQLETLA